jgi:PAT family beta-lactamase induction signal transducer AmpG
MLTGNGLIVIIGGYLEQEYGDKQKAWSYTMIIVGLMAALTTIIFLHLEQKTPKRRREIVRAKSKFWSRLFQKKTNWDRTSLYIIIFLGESQLLKMLTLSY